MGILTKFYCWLFGHVWYGKSYTGETVDSLNGVTYHYFDWVQLERCDRCSSKLDWTK